MNCTTASRGTRSHCAFHGIAGPSGSHRSRTTASALLVALTVAVATVAVLAAGAAGGTPPVRPPVVRFAFLHAVNGTFYDYDAVQLYAGLKSAEKYLNDADWLRNSTLVIEHVAVGAGWGFAQQVATATAAIGTGIAGFVAADWTSSAAAYAASGGAVPVIGSRSLTTNEFGDPQYAFVNSMRMPINVQVLTMLNHARNDDRTQCSYFALLYRPYFPTLTASFNATMTDLNVPFTMIKVGEVGEALNVSRVLDAYAGAAPFVIRCALLFVLPEDVMALLSAFYRDARFPRTMSYYASDFAAATRVFNDTQLGLAPYRRLYFVSDIGDYASPTMATAVRYRAALAAWLAASPALPRTLNASVGVEAVPNIVSYEGFSVGMMLGAVLRGAGGLTAAGWLEQIYEQSLFWLGDVLEGPFVNRCLTNPLLAMPCFCNVGPITSFVLGIDGSSGRIGPLAVDAIQAKNTYLPTALTDCFPGTYVLKSTIAIQLFAPLAMDAAAATAFEYLYQACRTQADVINTAGSLPAMRLSVGYMNQFVKLPASDALTGTMFAELATVRRPTVVIGSWYLYSDITMPVINLYTSPLTVAVDPPMTAATEYTRLTWLMKPTLADVTHACALLVARESAAGGGGTRVTAIADGALAYSLAERSLHTVQQALDNGSGVVDFGDAAALTERIVYLMRVAANGSRVVLFVAAMEVASVVNVVNAAVAATAALSGGGGALTRFAMVLASEVDFLYTAKYQLANTSALMQFPLYFATFLMPFFEAGNDARGRMAVTLNTSDPQVLDTQSVYVSAVIMNVLSTVLAIFTVRPSAVAAMDFLYAQGTVTAGGVTLGPFFPKNCTAAEVSANDVTRRCQCFKAMRTLNVYDFRGWLANSAAYNPQFQWAMPTCGPLYKPLLAGPEGLDVGLVVGVAVPCGLLAVAGVVYMMMCYGRRNNRAAPKDPNAPFAMVFTDIQSSTSLWARAPEAMADALEQHHELLRRLVGRHGGYEVKTIGDSFMVAFKRAGDAAGFALAIQTTLFDASWPAEIDEVYVALAQEQWLEAQEAEAEKTKSELSVPAPQGRAAAPLQWEDAAAYARHWNGIRVRVGMHWGLGSVKLDPVSQGYDYYGTLVNTAARVEGVGNGGQVLATKDMFEQLEAEGAVDGASVDVLPLGPQPLRGLDAPVPLFQLSPMRLRGRQFAALRLDVEVELDDDSTTDGATTGDTSTRLSEADDTPETHVDRLLRRAKDGAPHREYFLRVAGFLATALRAMPQSWRKDALKQLMKKWHVKQRTPPAGSKEPVERTMLFDVHSLAVRVGLAAEEALRVARGGVAGVSADGRSSRQLSYAATVSRMSEGGGASVKRLSVRRQSERISVDSVGGT